MRELILSNWIGPSFKSAASNEIVQPQLFGQFRFTPNGLPEAYQFRDDIDNEAIVVDATFDAGVNSDQADTNLKADQSGKFFSISIFV